MGKASAPSSGFNASTFMYGFIFMMYAVVACVLFWLMANRWVSGAVWSHLTSQTSYYFLPQERTKEDKTRTGKAAGAV